MIATAFTLGLIGSLHCAGMCGPLAIAVPVAGNTRRAFWLSRLLYNAGRIASYGTIGVIFGLIGKSVALAGFQRWLSIAAGLLILAGLFASYAPFKTAGFKLVRTIKTRFAALLGRRTYPAVFSLGALNGFLPCGLVYIAAAAAASTGEILASSTSMLAFGLGTLPVMLGLAWLGKTVQIRFPVQKLIPVSVTLVALLLILRGLALGIPYLSPELQTGAACH